MHVSVSFGCTKRNNVYSAISHVTMSAHAYVFLNISTEDNSKNQNVWNLNNC